MKNEDVVILRCWCQVAMFFAVICLAEVLSQRTVGVEKVIYGIAGVVLGLLSLCGTCWADSIEEARMKYDIRLKEEHRNELRRDD
jgi:hypothetical protein